MNKLLATMAILGLTACASTGVKVSDETLTHSLRVNETTLSQAEERLGPPSGSYETSAGTTISYVYSSAQARPESFIPFVGAFVGGADYEYRVVTLSFDANGVLRFETKSGGGSGTGYGIEGYSQNRKPVTQE